MVQNKKEISTESTGVSTTTTFYTPYTLVLLLNHHIVSRRTCYDASRKKTDVKKGRPKSSPGTKYKNRVQSATSTLATEGDAVPLTLAPKTVEKPSRPPSLRNLRGHLSSIRSTKSINERIEKQTNEIRAECRKEYEQKIEELENYITTKVTVNEPFSTSSFSL